MSTSPLNALFRNAKTGLKRTCPTTAGATNVPDIQGSLDDLRDMLEEVLAILQDSAEGSSVVPDYYVLKFVKIRLSHFIETH